MKPQTRLLSAAPFLLCILSCQSFPFVAQVETDGEAIVGADLEAVVVVAYAAAKVTLSDKGTFLPVFAVEVEPESITVCKLTKPRTSWGAKRGQPLAHAAREHVERVLTREQITELGLVFEVSP